MNFYRQPISIWLTLRGPWVLLAVSATSLVLAALYFQHVQGLIPCVQCVYQRTAMMAVAIFAWFGAIAPHKPAVRTIAWLGWLGSAAAGFYSAHHHIFLQTRANPLFTSCSPFPDFPSFAPLHEWFPSLFAAGGLCTEIDWSFLGLSMPGWLRVIFAVYIIIACTVFLTRIVQQRRI
ncbi:disulfide bond formation protein DsbB [Aliidiomarina sanyensis]|uniref:Disulfide bond formation protein B n=1 Tax=Aliidiomarina sanyensis TaxID=1249555 RepID=A0A432WNP5_9GAMM|nr:disulfide bond formation protein DsbB [Aliidiomarina sanyensis]RUO35329.1 disulfide bond formation protein DsbB [Aliidiomarina sanyensis]